MDKSRLQKQIDKGSTEREMADKFGVSQTTIRYWLKKFSLKTKNRQARRVNRSAQHVGTGNLDKCHECARKFVYTRKAGHRVGKCNSCYQAGRRRRRREQIYEAYGSKECKICEYSGPDRAMSWHHIYPEEKSFSIGGSECRSWKSVKMELDKCILLCVRCHAEVHSGMHDLAT